MCARSRVLCQGPSLGPAPLVSSTFVPGQAALPLPQDVLASTASAFSSPGGRSHLLPQINPPVTFSRPLIVSVASPDTLQFVSAPLDVGKLEYDPVIAKGVLSFSVCMRLGF